MTAKNNDSKHHLMLSLDTKLYKTIKAIAIEEDRSIPYVIKKILKKHVQGETSLNAM